MQPLHYFQMFDMLSFLRPGAYEHQVAKNRKVKFHGTFGGPQTLKASITVICHNGEPDRVSTERPGAFSNDIKYGSLYLSFAYHLYSKRLMKICFESQN